MRTTGEALALNTAIPPFASGWTRNAEVFFFLLDGSGKSVIAVLLLLALFPLPLLILLFRSDKESMGASGSSYNDVLESGSDADASMSAAVACSEDENSIPSVVPPLRPFSAGVGRAPPARSFFRRW